MVVIRATARYHAVKEWNVDADEFNQWSVLSRDEKTELIDEQVILMGGDRRTVRITEGATG